MNRVGLLLLLVLALFAAPARLLAQENDPSEVFLKAYMTSQQGEKLERENQLKAALAKLRFAGSMLEELRKQHSDWQPAITEYRSRKIGESILRVEKKLATQADLAATAATTETAEPTIAATQPIQSTATPSVEIGASRPQPTPNPKIADAAIQSATKELRAKVDALEGELKKSHEQYDRARTEKQELAGKLRETDSKLAEAQGALQKTRQAEREVRDQLTKARD